MSAGGQTNPLLNKAVSMDSGMLMNILIELINSKPLACLPIPDFRIDQMIKYAQKKIGPLTERKTLEPLCALFSLCMFYAMSTTYNKSHIFRILALFQVLQSEALISISNFGGKKFVMSDLALTLQKHEDVDIDYKLEIFTEALAVARLTCRDLYALMKVVFRVGRRGAQSLAFTQDEKRKQAKYAECIQPHSVYFMCAFAYAHIATMLHNSQQLNIYPGTIESFIVMVLTTTPGESARSLEQATSTVEHSAEAIIRAIQLEEAQRAEADAENGEEGDAPKAAAVVTLKLDYETFMETAHKLAVFVAHIIFDDRNLQEARIAHARMSRNFDHPDVAFAQFRVSGAKALLVQDQLPSSHPHPGSSTAHGKALAGSTVTGTSTSSSTAAALAVATGNKPDQLRHAGKGNETSKAVTTTAVTATSGAMKADNSSAKLGHISGALVDITANGYHFLWRASAPEAWHLQDPSEADYDFNAPTAKAQSPNRLTAERLASMPSKKAVLPSLAINRQGLTSARGARDAPSARDKAAKPPTGAVETISDLPPPSGRITDRNAVSASTRQRSARGRPRSGRSISSDGERSDSETGTEEARTATATASASARPSSLFGANPYAPPTQNKYSTKIQSAAGPDDAFMSLDQKIAGFWAMGKQYRPGFLLLDTLQVRREYQVYFSAEYKPASYELDADADLLRVAPLGGKPVYEACKIIEAQYYYLSAAVCLPRILDPTQDVYWICNFLIEFLAKKTTMGLGFHPSVGAELNVLKKQFKEVKAQSKSGSAATAVPSLSATFPAPPVKTSGGTKVHLPALATLSTSPDKKDKERRYQNIQDRLAAAAMEAGIESKVFSMQKKLWKEESTLHSPERRASPSRSRLHSDFSDGESAFSHSTSQPQQHKPKDAGVVSVVWTCQPHKDKSRGTTFVGQEEDYSENPFKEPISKQAAIEYSKKMNLLKKEKAEEEAQFQQYLEDQKESLIARNRAAKEERIRAQREQTKNELLNKTKFKQEWEAMQRKQAQMERARARIEAKEKEDSDLREMLHVKEVKLIHESRLRQEEIQRKEALRLEAAKIQLLTSESEVAIINRQNQEEARMKYLEERRRAVEDKIAQVEINKKAKLAKKQVRTAETRDRIQARVRMGTFKWHNGVYGFYDSVRKEPVEWVQYEDANGTPYYYDPVTKTTQHRVPQDANIHHYTDDERREYDAIHGEGAYDEFKADRAFKDGINRDGGYYNEQGKWIPMDGYYDENYEWVANEGYYDENGNYRKYAKVCGDLSFMV